MSAPLWECDSCGPQDTPNCDCRGCECCCDSQMVHQQGQREQDTYWRWYFGITPTRGIRESGHTVAIEDGDAPGGWRYEMIGGNHG